MKREGEQRKEWQKEVKYGDRGSVYEETGKEARKGAPVGDVVARQVLCGKII